MMAELAGRQGVLVWNMSARNASARSPLVTFHNYEPHRFNETIIAATKAVAESTTAHTTDRAALVPPRWRRQKSRGDHDENLKKKANKQRKAESKLRQRYVPCDS
jgi:hypothetical protein